MVTPIDAAMPTDKARSKSVDKSVRLMTKETSEVVYQNATANDTTTKATLIIRRINPILPFRIRRTIAEALAPKANTKINALRDALVTESPVKGVTCAVGAPLLNKGYPRNPVTTSPKATGRRCLGRGLKPVPSVSAIGAIARLHRQS